MAAPRLHAKAEDQNDQSRHACDGAVADRRRRSADHSDWACRFNARGPDALDGKATGRTLEAQRRSPPRLAEVVEAGPVPAVDGVVRRRKDLARWLLETFAIS